MINPYLGLSNLSTLTRFIAAVVPFREHLVNDTKIQCLLSVEEGVPLHHAFNVRQRLPRMVLVELIQGRSDAKDFLGLDGDVAGHALRAPRGLVQHDARVGQRAPLARSTASQ